MAEQSREADYLSLTERLEAMPIADGMLTPEGIAWFEQQLDERPRRRVIGPSYDAGEAR